MDTRSQITLRTKKLGVLIRDARLASRRDVDECAKAIGVTKGIFRAYEEGKRAPSLPELEILVYYLKLPINHFWGQASISDDASSTEPLDLPRLVEVRQRMIGALLRQQRNNTSLSIKSLVQETSIPGDVSNPMNWASVRFHCQSWKFWRPRWEAASKLFLTRAVLSVNGWAIKKAFNNSSSFPKNYKTLSANRSIVLIWNWL